MTVKESSKYRQALVKHPVKILITLDEDSVEPLREVLGVVIGPFLSCTSADYSYKAANKNPIIFRSSSGEDRCDQLHFQ